MSSPARVTFSASPACTWLWWLDFLISSGNQPRASSPPMDENRKSFRLRLERFNPVMIGNLGLFSHKKFGWQAGAVEFILIEAKNCSDFPAGLGMEKEHCSNATSRILPEISCFHRTGVPIDQRSAYPQRPPSHRPRISQFLNGQRTESFPSGHH